MKPWLTKQIKLLSWISLCTDLASEMLYPVMPIFLATIGYSALGIGLLEGFAEATAGLSKGYFGSMSDRTGKRVPFIKLGYTLSAASKPLMAFWPVTAWVFGMRTLDRLGKGIRTSARDAMLADDSSAENRAKVFGFHRSMDTVGAFLGPLMALGFLYLFPQKYMPLFFISVLPGFLTIALCYFLKDKSLPKVKNIRPAFWNFLFYYKIATPVYRKAVGILFLFALLNGSDMFLIMKLKAIGASDVGAIGAYILYNFVYASFAFPLGKLADKRSPKNIIAFGLILFSIAYLGIAFSKNLWVAFLFFAIYGLFPASTEGIAKAWITSICKKEETATAIGFFAGLQSVLILLAGLITGGLWLSFGPTVALAVSGIGTLFIFVLLISSNFSKAETR